MEFLPLYCVEEIAYLRACKTYLSNGDYFFYIENASAANLITITNKRETLMAF